MSGRVGFPESPTPWMHSFEDLEKACLDANKKVLKKTVVVKSSGTRSRLCSERTIDLVFEVVEVFFRKDQPEYRRTFATIFDGIIDTGKTRTISLFCDNSLYFPDVLTFDSSGFGKNLAIRVVNRKELKGVFYEDVGNKKVNIPHKEKWSISITGSDSD